jgi:type II secretory pathway component PulL
MGDSTVLRGPRRLQSRRRGLTLSPTSSDSALTHARKQNIRSIQMSEVQQLKDRSIPEG